MWTKHVDGFVKGDIGVFPWFFGSWMIYRKIDGEWYEINHPEAMVSARGVTRGLSGWYVCWEKTQEQVIEEVKRLAEDRWL